MPEIFVNYRTGDAHDAATTIQLDLCRRFGADSVFFASRSLAFGKPFPPALIQEVAKAGVLIAVIGPDWVKRTDGKRLLDDERDWVRREITEAFRCGTAVIPVLVGRHTERLPDDLPEDIKTLVDYPYCRYDHREVTSDLDQIAAAVTEILPDLVDQTRTEPVPPAGAFTSAHQSGGIGQITMSGGSIGAAVVDNHGNINTGSGPQHVHPAAVQDET